MKIISNIFFSVVLISAVAAISLFTGLFSGAGVPVPPGAAPLPENMENGTGSAEGTFFDRHGALHVSGTKLTDMHGEPVVLRGVSTHGLAWFPQYISEDSFRSLRDDWNVNLIRLAMYTEEYGGYCSGGDRAKLEELIDKGASICRDLGIYCIIDWHILSDGNPNAHTAEAVDFFSRMSQKYASWDNIIYEICNEPNGTPWSEVKRYADTVIPVIRANAPDAVILAGTPNWSQDVDIAASDPVANPYNVMYSLHFYAATHGDFLRGKLNTALEKGAPVFVSEFSICDASGNGAVDYDSAEKWKELMNSRGISCAAWNLSNKAEASALLQPGCDKLSGWDDSELSETGRWMKAFFGA